MRARTAEVKARVGSVPVTSLALPRKPKMGIGISVESRLATAENMGAEKEDELKCPPWLWP